MGNARDMFSILMSKLLSILWRISVICFHFITYNSKMNISLISAVTHTTLEINIHHFKKSISVICASTKVTCALYHTLVWSKRAMLPPLPQSATLQTSHRPGPCSLHLGWHIHGKSKPGLAAPASCEHVPFQVLLPSEQMVLWHTERWKDTGPDAVKRRAWQNLCWNIWMTNWSERWISWNGNLEHCCQWTLRSHENETESDFLNKVINYSLCQHFKVTAHAQNEISVIIYLFSCNL